jgi:hypothetical protein
MSGRNSRTAGAAVAAAPAQTAATAGEAGLPIVTPPADEQSGEAEPSAGEETEEPAPAHVFDLERFTAAIESLSDEDFMSALEAMYGEGYSRELLTLDTPAELESAEVPAAVVAEAAPADEHAETRELLARFNLKRAWVDTEGGVHYDEKAARKAAGDNADSLTIIEA